MASDPKMKAELKQKPDSPIARTIIEMIESYVIPLLGVYFLVGSYCRRP